MKKLYFFLVLVTVMFAQASFAQINTGSDFTHGAAPTYYTDSVLVTNTGVDTFFVPCNPYRNSVGFQINVRKVSGNPSSVTIHVWGSKATLPSGGYTDLTDLTIANTAGLQVFNYDINNGVGNPFRWYMITILGAGTQSIRCLSYFFIR